MCRDLLASTLIFHGPPPVRHAGRGSDQETDLRFLQGYLADLADEDHTVVPRGSEHLAWLARRKAVSVGKIADAFEAALAQPVEDE